MLYPLICGDEDTTESPFISKNTPSNCVEPDKTPSEFILSFTLVSKFVIVFAFTCEEQTLHHLEVNQLFVEPDTTESPFISKNTPSNCAEEDITPSPLVFRYLVSKSLVNCVI